MYQCPVCGYPDLDEQPWVGDSASFEICPSCGTQFGYSDAAPGGEVERIQLHRRLREVWSAAGYHWHFAHQGPPPDWDPVVQLARVKD
jgi:hypothetical protein